MILYYYILYVYTIIYKFETISRSYVLAPPGTWPMRPEVTRKNDCLIHVKIMDASPNMNKNWSLPSGSLICI